VLGAEGSAAGFTLYEFADRLRERGWLVPAYSMPPDREDLVIQRILIRHGFTRAMGGELLARCAPRSTTLPSTRQRQPRLLPRGQPHTTIPAARLHACR